MKKLILILTGFALACSVQAVSLADARSQIGACISDASKMSELVKQLDKSADQVAFLREVNEAIADMPASSEVKAATFLNVNKAALKAAKSKTEMLAEVFATVSPEALPVLTERMAADLFNRSADPSKTYTDEAFMKIAETTLSNVVARAESGESGAARSAFAIVMFQKASNGSPSDLVEKLVQQLPEAFQSVAAKEWIPPALGATADETPDYQPLLDACDAPVSMPSTPVVLRVAGPQLLDSLLGDVVENTPLVAGMLANEYGIGTGSSSDMTMTVAPPSTPPKYPKPQPEPEPYPGQW